MPGESSTLWWPWALLAAVVAGLATWFGVAAAKRRRWDSEFATDLAEARWVADSLVPSATNRALPAEQVAQQWLDGKRRLDDLQSDLYRLGASIPTTERATRLGQVSGSLGALQEALQADVALRSPAATTATATSAAATPADANALDASLQHVARRREALIAAIENHPVAPTHAAG